MAIQSPEQASNNSMAANAQPLQENSQDDSLEVKLPVEKEKQVDPLAKLKLWLDLGKFVVGTVLLGLFTTVINAQIQNKEIELERLKAEQEHLSQFVDQAMSDRLIHRIRFAKYFATLTFSEASRNRWQEYYQHLDEERLAKEERLAVIYGALPEERERAINTDDREILDALLVEKESLENDVGLIPRAFSSEEEFWTEEKLNSPILDEVVFTWRDAIVLNGDVQIPTRPGVVDNIKEMARKLQEIQDELGQPIEIVRWYDVQPTNRRVGEAPSLHEFGSAVKIRIPGYSPRELAELLSDWPGGMGLYPTMLHLDNRPNQLRWGFE